MKGADHPPSAISSRVFQSGNIGGFVGGGGHGFWRILFIFYLFLLLDISLTFVLMSSSVSSVYERVRSRNDRVVVKSKQLR